MDPISVLGLTLSLLSSVGLIAHVGKNAERVLYELTRHIEDFNIIRLTIEESSKILSSQIAKPSKVIEAVLVVCSQRIDEFQQFSPTLEKIHAIRNKSDLSFRDSVRLRRREFRAVVESHRRQLVLDGLRDAATLLRDLTFRYDLGSVYVQAI